jgi:hypothetical protein
MGYLFDVEREVEKKETGYSQREIHAKDLSAPVGY